MNKVLWWDRGGTKSVSEWGKGLLEKIMSKLCLKVTSMTTTG